ncbi:MAG: branched-chain amino acid ABC transporter permease [Desulfobacteraceae bacterium]|jgi:branched-chain amino acid transport system permease protein|nr:branched-chain amino acid ABC transporter permease [Desulfobacteraceae bacterium]
MLDLIIVLVFNGLVLGMIYVLLAMGLSIVWGMMDIINFAHGLFFALGAYFAYTLVSLTGNFWLCLIIVPLATGLVGMFLEYTLLRRLYGLNILYQILMTFGIALAGREIIILIYNPIGKSFYPPDILSGVIQISGIFFPKYRIFVFTMAVLVTLCMWLFIEKTKYGSIIRAGTEDAEMVSSLGINIPRVFLLIFGLSMAIAGLSGVLAAPIRGIEPYMGWLILGICFAVVIIGGMGSFIGAILGGLIAGLSQSLVTLVMPSASIVVIWLVMAVILLIRPRGLMGIRD